MIEQNKGSKDEETDYEKNRLRTSFTPAVARGNTLIKPENKASKRVALKAGMKLDKEVMRQENIPTLLYRKTNASV